MVDAAELPERVLPPAPPPAETGAGKEVTTVDMREFLEKTLSADQRTTITPIVDHPTQADIRYGPLRTLQVKVKGSMAPLTITEFGSGDGTRHEVSIPSDGRQETSGRWDIDQAEDGAFHLVQGQDPKLVTDLRTLKADITRILAENRAIADTQEEERRGTRKEATPVDLVALITEKFGSHLSPIPVPQEGLIPGIGVVPQDRAVPLLSRRGDINFRGIPLASKNGGINYSDGDHVSITEETHPEAGVVFTVTDETVTDEAGRHPAFIIDQSQDEVTYVAPDGTRRTLDSAEAATLFNRLDTLDENREYVAEQEAAKAASEHTVERKGVRERILARRDRKHTARRHQPKSLRNRAGSFVRTAAVAGVIAAGASGAPVLAETLHEASQPAHSQYDQSEAQGERTETEKRLDALMQELGPQIREFAGNHGGRDEQFLDPISNKTQISTTVDLAVPVVGYMPEGTEVEGRRSFITSAESWPKGGEQYSTIAGTVQADRAMPLDGQIMRSTFVSTNTIQLTQGEDGHYMLQLTEGTVDSDGNPDVQTTIKTTDPRDADSYDEAITDEDVDNVQEQLVEMLAKANANEPIYVRIS